MATPVACGSAVKRSAVAAAVRRGCGELLRPEPAAPLGLWPLSTGIISQVARPPHGTDNGCTLWQAQGAGDVEAEVLVERHVSHIRGFEVGEQSLLIASPEPRAQQGCADPVSVPGRIDPDDGQIPMRLFCADGRRPPWTETSRRRRDGGRRPADSRGGRTLQSLTRCRAGTTRRLRLRAHRYGPLPPRRGEATHGAVRSRKSGAVAEAANPQLEASNRTPDRHRRRGRASERSPPHLHARPPVSQEQPRTPA
jgi:hypothetical protein